MKRVFAMLLLSCVPTLLAAAHPLEGKWLGGIDTDRGQMQIGLELKEDQGKLTGAIKTAHGDWAVKSVTESNGTFTVTFDAGDHEGKLTGRVADGTFKGEWDNRPMASGTFELKKAVTKSRAPSRPSWSFATDHSSAPTALRNSMM